jgi:hypothetical protein
MATENRYVAVSPQDDAERGEPPVCEPELWVELEIERPPDEDCPVAGLSDTEATGSVQLTGDRCHAQLSFSEDDVTVYTASVEAGCACAGVCGPGITPVDLSVEDGILVVGAYVADRDRLAAVVDSLRASGDDWQLRRLTTPDRNRAVDAGLASQLLGEVSITEKQREAVRTAIAMGYYADPREATLGDLASRLGVSRSALSQRLNAVESKLVESLAAEL